MKLMKKIKKDIKFQLSLFLLFILNLFLIFNFSLENLLGSLAFIISCLLAELAFSKALKLRANYSSALITSLILSLLILNLWGVENYILNALIWFFAIFLKFVSKKITWLDSINPVAFWVLWAYLVSFLIPDLRPIIWWSGVSFELFWINIVAILTILYGLYLAKKIKKLHLIAFTFLSFIFASVAFLNFEVLKFNLLSWTLYFFILIMVTDIKTSPIKKIHQISWWIFMWLLLAIATALPSEYRLAYPFLMTLAFYNLFVFFSKKSLMINKS